MARKERQITITAGTPESNRDHGKVFTIREMSATDAERWASDAIHGLTAAGVELPDDLAGAGVSAIASIGLKALGGMHPDTFHGLMDRMFACIGYIPDPTRPEIWRGEGTREGAAAPVGRLMESDIEEVSTRLRLRVEWFSLTTGFSLADVRSLAAQKAPALN